MRVFFNRSALGIMRTLFGLALLSVALMAKAADLPDTIAKIKPSIVGVGSYLPTRAPQGQLFGTGFVVDDGYHVITNAHVAQKKLKASAKEKLVVFVGTGKQGKMRDARILAVDEAHDLALLRISGPAMPALSIGDSEVVREGESYAFTGFPLGFILGLYPATHRGIISSITPIATPVSDSKQLTPDLIKRLKDSYRVFQLDATAYPGNSGSPLFNKDTGEVVGVINRVFVQGAKEAAIEHPSGITYAIPSLYVKRLLQQTKQH